MTSRFLPWTGHPGGLKTLFFTEAWERFSFYGMRALLVLYLTDATTGLGMAKDNALLIYATYTGLVYLTPLFGGWLADRYLGQRISVLIGSVVMAAGHFAMAFDALFEMGLGLLIVGNGFFKPNVSTMVGGLYDDGDSRKDSGYTVFYMGINLGAFFSPLVCGTLGEKVGWHWGFGAAGVGMIIGMLWFLANERSLGSAGLPPGREVIGDGPHLLTSADKMRATWISALCIVGVALALVAKPALAFVWNMPPLIPEDANELWRIAWRLVVIGGAIWLLNNIGKGKHAEPLSREEKDGLVMIGITTLAMAIFVVGLEQAGGTLNLFAKERTELNIFGWEIPASFFQSVNPAWIIILAPLFARMWTGRFKGMPSVRRQAYGLMILSVSFVVMFVAQKHSDALVASNAEVGISPLWLITVYFFITASELCISPVGLSVVQKLSPRHMVSMLMATFFVGVFVANYLAGTLGQILEAWSINLWAFLFVFPLGCGVVWWLFTPWARKLSHGRD
ncbi:MAG: peptide MFS transporter [Bdellovibrionales bacterium]|nr:peptide MFS transporter [Bdellovibrionales bacterium]